jgi:hypothetical protein
MCGRTAGGEVDDQSEPERAPTVTPLNTGDLVEFEVVSVVRSMGRMARFAERIRRTTAAPRPRRRGVINILRPPTCVMIGAHPLPQPGPLHGPTRLAGGARRSGFVSSPGLDKAVYFPLDEFRNAAHALTEGDEVRSHAATWWVVQVCMRAV